MQHPQYRYGVLQHPVDDQVVRPHQAPVGLGHQPVASDRGQGWEWNMPIVSRFIASNGRSVTKAVTPSGVTAYLADEVLTLPLESVPHSRVTNWLALVDGQASLSRTSSGW
jgi:hypothetical protein